MSNPIVSHAELRRYLKKRGMKLRFDYRSSYDKNRKQYSCMVELPVAKVQAGVMDCWFRSGSEEITFAFGQPTWEYRVRKAVGS